MEKSEQSSFPSEEKLFGEEETLETMKSSNLIAWVSFSFFAFFLLIALLNFSGGEKDYSKFYTENPSAQAILFSATW